MIKVCDCGSGKARYELRDAAGNFCRYVCDACVEKKKRAFNPAIFETGTPYAVTGDEADIDLPTRDGLLKAADAVDRYNADKIDGYDRDDLGESPDY